MKSTVLIMEKMRLEILTIGLEGEGAEGMKGGCHPRLSMAPRRPGAARQPRRRLAEDAILDCMPGV